MPVKKIDKQRKIRVTYGVFVTFIDDRLPQRDLHTEKITTKIRLYVYWLFDENAKK